MRRAVIVRVEQNQNRPNVSPVPEGHLDGTFKLPFLCDSVSLHSEGPYDLNIRYAQSFAYDTAQQDGDAFRLGLAFHNWGN